MAQTNEHGRVRHVNRDSRTSAVIFSSAEQALCDVAETLHFVSELIRACPASSFDEEGAENIQIRKGGIDALHRLVGRSLRDDVFAGMEELRHRLSDYETLHDMPGERNMLPCNSDRQACH